ncbi:flagellar basal-body rod modification protein FlgD [Scopulibacillus daqui]|uniref:Flagellar basal-body rod modification protein FlgD n=1 Tax=Scopulibacillus daqui TaxID=1469162 RepID=A0ABS2PWW9_9BACL|nr:flagellar hook capping FlgD N-terminal domain-containing protein [Scopulibacillus daqui]MBM7644361.1 flagellar basal-body rod modification protein FlgD [Scopulibacillus daqui]
MKIADDLYLENKPDEKKLTSNSNLGKDDFLKLLITELKNQDPMQPMDNKDLISQMAAFTSLEQTQNMSGSIDKFVNMQSQNLLASQVNMIGKHITWNKSFTDADSSHVIDQIISLVTGIAVKDGKVKYVSDTGETIDPGQIISISAKQRAIRF